MSRNAILLKERYLPVFIVYLYTNSKKNLAKFYSKRT